MRLLTQLPCNASISKESQRCSSSSPSPADGSTLRAMLPKKRWFLSFHCPEAQTKGTVSFSCPQTVTAHSLHCFTLFGNTDSAAEAPPWMCNFALLLPQPLLHQGWRAQFRREALPEPGSDGQVLSLHGTLDIYRNFPAPGGS